MKLNATPKQDGFKMPAEYAPHSATYMIFPHRPDNWRADARYAQKVFSEVANAIALFEPVKMLVCKSEIAHAQNLLSSRVQIFECPSDDAWARDTGATFVINGEGVLRAIDWKFNAWGGEIDGLYKEWGKDDNIAQKMAQIEHADRYRLDDFVLEGGSICTDGEGTLITTEACLLSKGRNPHLTKSQIEEKLKNYLNIEKIIWLRHGIYEDETNEHVDNICCFVNKGELVLAWTDDKNDPQYEMSKSCLDILSDERDARGNKIKVHKLPLPRPQFRADDELCISSGDAVKRLSGERLAASYVNFYICNNAVIMPAFNDPNDKTAAQILEKLFLGRKIIPIYSREILLGGGNIHCITQQVPRHFTGERNENS
jgi:agmatine deiminase